MEDPAQKARCDSLQHRLYSHTALLLIRSTPKPNVSFDGNGSGVLLEHEGHWYVATAAHVVEAAQQRCGLASFPSLTPMKTTYQESDAIEIPLQKVHSHPNSDRDLALVEVGEVVVKQLRLEPITIGDFDLRPLPDDPHRATCAWAGFPFELRRTAPAEVAIGFNVSATSPWVPFPISAADPRFAHQPKLAVDPEYDVWVHRPKTGMSMQTGEPIDISEFDVPGISGCGLWRLPDPPAADELHYFAKRVKLVGIQHRRHELVDGSQVIRGVSAKAISEILES